MLDAAAKQRRDGQAGGDRVLLMSVHRVKGLEFPKVWVIGCNEKILPHGRGDIEEERRIAYVAITRARDELVMSWVRSFANREGVSSAASSRFIAEAGLQAELLTVARVTVESAEPAPDSGDRIQVERLPDAAGFAYGTVRVCGNKLWMVAETAFGKAWTAD